MTTILRGLLGSHAYGMAHENSDKDYGGVFVAPISQILGRGLTTSEETNDADSCADSWEHELAKTFRLAHRGNPSVLELLFLPEYELTTPMGEEFLVMRDSFLGRIQVRNAYTGYMQAQLKRLSRGQVPDGRREKHARHIIRLGLQGKELLETGKLTVRLTDEQVAVCREAGLRACIQPDRFIEKAEQLCATIHEAAEDSALIEKVNPDPIWEKIADLRMRYADGPDETTFRKRAVAAYDKIGEINYRLEA